MLGGVEIDRKAINVLVDEGNRENTSCIIELRERIMSRRSSEKYNVLSYHTENKRISHTQESHLLGCSVLERGKRIGNSQQEIETTLDPFIMPGRSILVSLFNEIAHLDHRFGVHDVIQISGNGIASAEKEGQNFLQETREAKETKSS